MRDPFELVRQPEASDHRVVVVGASGYVGGRLVDRLVAEGVAPVLAGRDTAALEGRWPDLEARRLDLDVVDSIEPALAGIEVAYYLARSSDGTDRGAQRQAAQMRAFADVAMRAGVRRVIHLTSLWDPASASEAPRGTGLQVTELRAGVILGSGSASFEVLRYLMERVPILMTPRWVRVRCEPIGIGDVVSFLVAALRHPEVTGRVEIGCGEVVTFGEMLRQYGQARDIRRPVIPLPVWAPRLSAAWIHLVSPVPGEVARPLVRALSREAVVRDARPAAHLGVVTRRFDDVMRRAVDRRDSASTTWFDAVRRRREPLLSTRDLEGMYLDYRELIVDAPPGAVYAAVSRIGGATGWPNAQFLWELRGLFDRAVGGPGMRRGRRDPIDLRVGDVVDFWRVEACSPPEVLRLCAEMKLPGPAWLQFVVKPVEGGRSQLQQTAYFEPHGVLGFLYWWSVFPFHAIVFGGMINELGRRAVVLAAREPRAHSDPVRHGGPEPGPPAAVEPAATSDPA